MAKYRFEVSKKMNGEVIEKRTSTFDTENILAGGLAPELYQVPQQVFDKIDTDGKVSHSYTTETILNIEKLL